MSEMAKTLVFTGVRQIELREYPIPEVPDDKILVKVEASAICTWEQRVYTGVKKVDFPFIGGHEVFGRIMAMGDKVDQREWKIGDGVVVGAMLPCKNCYRCKSGNEQNCEHFNHSKQLDGLPEKGMGCLSSHLLMDPSNLFHVENVSPEAATVTEPLSCVLHSVETAEIGFGDIVVVIGCGIMGLLHVLLSVRRGACVVVSDTNEERTALALRLGASYAVNPAKEDLLERVLEIAGGLKAQVVFDTTPISAVAEDAVKVVGNNGKLVLYSSFYPDKPITISPDWLHKSGAKLLGTANSNSVDFVKASRLISLGIVDVQPFVSEVYELKDYKQAFESAAKGDKFRVVIKFS
ncbi:MAG: alcohol dehydrogenase catalytic domain-containing protein [Clostridiales bacterium]|nr:alcohol dehydrogenase catalytic domain-containing protein [Clostridiales bacterium]